MVTAVTVIALLVLPAAVAGCDTQESLALDDQRQTAAKSAAATRQTVEMVVPNSIDTIIDDMRLMNDLPLAGIPSHYGWAKGPGQVVMGNDPRGSAAPSFWRPADQRFRSDTYWKVILPWFVIFDGEGHAARNTRVHVRSMQIWLKSRRTQQWFRLGAASKVEGFTYRKHLHGSAGAKSDVRPEKGNSVSIKPPLGNHVFHGWCCGRTKIDGPDVEAVWVTLEARLIPDLTSGADDRSQAKLMIQVGADYYPEVGTSVDEFKPDSYNPGVGLSRSKLVTNEWRSFNFATLNVGHQIGSGKAISVENFRSNPPPLGREQVKADQSPS